jgi:ribosomal protein S18 acetylase RimI-like enzyme
MSNPAIDIRPATTDDAATIVRFQILMARETEGIELDPPTVSRGVTAVYADSRKGRYFVAEVDGAVAGSLLVIDEWSDWRNGTVWWIHSVYVRPEFRRNGIFRALYAHLKQIVQSDPNLRGLRLYVHKDNRAAQSAYARLGMDGEHYRMFEWMK